MGLSHFSKKLGLGSKSSTATLGVYIGAAAFGTARAT